MSADAQSGSAGLAHPEQVIDAPAAPARRRWGLPWSSNGFSDDDAFLDDELEAQDVQVRSWVPIAMLSILIIALLARFSAADHLSPQIDEAATVMAAHMVAEDGLPIVPSKIPYFQGATLSYALAPFDAVGAGDMENLSTMRFISVIAGVLMVFFVYKLGRVLTGEAWPAVLAAGMVAIEPMSIRWSGYLRMYGPLQMFSMMLAYCYARVILQGPTRRLLAWCVALFWLGVFTHVAMVLVWPAMALIAAVTYGRQLRDERRDISIMLGLCLGAPIALTLVNRLLSPSDRRVSSEMPVFSFVGDHVLSLRALLHPNFASYQLLFSGSALVHLMPYVFFGITFLLIGAYLVRKPSEEDRKIRAAVGFLLAFYWVPMLLVAIFTNEPQERYVIHFQAFGFLVIALGVQLLVERLPKEEAETIWQARLYRWSGLFLAALVLVHIGSGINFLTNNTVLDPDYVDASEYVAARKLPGEKVIVGLSPAPYLTFDGAEDLIFLPGPWYSLRAVRYTRVTDEAKRIDYWAGAPAYVTTAELCNTLLNEPDTWLIIDDLRLRAAWAYGGEMAAVIRGLTYEAYRGQGDSLVMRVRPAPSRDARAERICQAALGESRN
jgi:hypothetical protein